MAKVAFTGSTEVGRSIAAGAAQTIKRVTLELGGKSANVVFADADIQAAAAAAPGAVFGNAGQDCCARSRILVERSALDAFMEAFEEAVEAIKVGDPLDEATEMGPLISAGQRETVASFVPEGAPVAIRGSAPDGPGYWYPPTVLCPVDPGDRAVREEIFGPVAVVLPFRDEAEAVALANDTIYGLSGSVWTRDGAKALRVARGLETGVISVNSNTSVRVSTPFGGFKQSGVGRELGPHALEHYSEVKTVYYATGMSRLARKVCVITGAAGGIGAATVQRFQDEGATVVGVDLADDAPGDLSLAADVTDEDASATCTRACARSTGRSTCCSTTPASPPPTTRRCSTPRRGLAARPGRQPQVGLPLLQARDPAPAGDRRRLGHQHRLVRGGDGRGDVADLLHRLQGRRAGADARAGRRVRPPRRARQRALPRPGRHAAAARALRQRPRGGGAAHGPRADGPLRRGGRARQRGACSWLRTKPRTSRPRPSWSTAASPAPTSRRCSGSHTSRSRGVSLVARGGVPETSSMPSTELRIFAAAMAVETAHLLDDGLRQPPRRRHRRALDADRGAIASPPSRSTPASPPGGERCSPASSASPASRGLDMHVIPALRSTARAGS